MGAVALPRRLLAEFARASAPGFIAAQFIGALLGLGLILVLYPDAASTADDVVVPHDRDPLGHNVTEQRSST